MGNCLSCFTKRQVKVTTADVESNGYSPLVYEPLETASVSTDPIELPQEDEAKEEVAKTEIANEVHAVDDAIDSAQCSVQLSNGQHHFQSIQTTTANVPNAASLPISLVSGNGKFNQANSDKTLIRVLPYFEQVYKEHGSTKNHIEILVEINRRLGVHIFKQGATMVDGKFGYRTQVLMLGANETFGTGLTVELSQLDGATRMVRYLFRGIERGLLEKAKIFDGNNNNLAKPIAVVKGNQSDNSLVTFSPIEKSQFMAAFSRLEQSKMKPLLIIEELLKDFPTYIRFEWSSGGGQQHFCTVFIGEVLSISGKGNARAVAWADAANNAVQYLKNNKTKLMKQVQEQVDQTAVSSSSVPGTNLTSSGIKRLFECIKRDGSSSASSQLLNKLLTQCPVDIKLKRDADGTVTCTLSNGSVFVAQKEMPKKGTEVLCQMVCEYLHLVQNLNLNDVSVVDYQQLQQRFSQFSQKPIPQAFDKLQKKCNPWLTRFTSTSGPEHELIHYAQVDFKQSHIQISVAAKRLNDCKGRLLEELGKFLTRMTSPSPNAGQCKSISNVSQSVSTTLDPSICRSVYTAVAKFWNHLPAVESSQFQVLAAFVVIDAKAQSSPLVLSIGTGTKWIASEHLALDGTAVHDSHAEIIARRALLCCLYNQLEALREDPDQQKKAHLILEPTKKGFRLKANLQLYLYISKAPCGSVQRHPTDDVEVIQVKQPAGNSYLAQTSTNQPQPDYSKLKSGEERTSFLSCSQKITMWNVVGVQGGLLSGLIEPIYLNGIVVSEDYEHESIVRALYGRVDQGQLKQNLGTLDGQFRLHQPKIGYYRIENHLKLSGNTKNTDLSYNWYRTVRPPVMPIETIDAKKGQKEKNAQVSRLAKVELANRYKKLTSFSSAKGKPPLRAALLPDAAPTSGNTLLDVRMKDTYAQLKGKSIRYSEAKQALIKTLEQSGLGQWRVASLNVDLFRV